MKLGLYLRNMGPASTRKLITAAAVHAENAGVDDLWVADHIAIPPDDAEGSGGRYLDALATLAYLAGKTEQIGLGTGVLVLPYRPPLATAKWLATIQELSENRLRLGIGAGWMDAEFRAVGVARKHRGRITDETLDFFERCFSHDEVEQNGQPFLFKPRPAKPKVYVGGAGSAAFRRTIRFGDGWMPMGTDPKKLALKSSALRQQASEAGRPDPEILLITTLPLDDGPRAASVATVFREAGATGIVHAARYESEAELAGVAEALGRLREELS